MVVGKGMVVGGKEKDLGGLDGSCIDGHVIAGTLPLFSPNLKKKKKKKIGPSRMSPKAQRPLRGAKTLSSPSSRPSGEASVPPPPAGKIPAVLHEEMVRGVNSQLLECWAGRVPR